MARQILHDTGRRYRHALTDKPCKLLIAVRPPADAPAPGNDPMPGDEIAFILVKLREHRDDERHRDADLRRKPFRRRNVPKWNFAQ